MLLLIVVSVHVLLQGLAVFGSDDHREYIRSKFLNLRTWKHFHHLGLRGHGSLGRPQNIPILSLVYGSMDTLEFGEGIGVGLGSAFDEDSEGSAILQAIFGRSFLLVSVMTREDASLPPPSFPSWCRFAPVIAS
jgi:hypothetical protein